MDEQFIRGLPKAELHLHIEGTLEPETMFELARRNGVELRFASVEEVRAAYSFGDLQSFLDIYYEGMNVLREERDFFDLTRAYLERAAADGVRHTEIFFDPQAHTDRGIAFETLVTGIRRALDEGQRDLGISSRLILCFLRHLPEEAALATLEEALPHSHLLTAVGLDSSEVGHPPEDFVTVFAKAREAGLRVVAHAGEEGPPEYIRQALDLLKAERIDHGVRCEEDPELVERLIAEKVPLTVCPLSNVKLGVVDAVGRHNLRRLLSRGVRVTLNSDDPAYFGGYIGDNYIAAWRELDLSGEEIGRLARNSFEASFLDDDEKAARVREVDEYMAAGG
ncbi:MAG: adenosine deaminase [Dehalococcoidia bacterium]